MFEDGQLIKSIPLHDGSPFNHQERTLLRRRVHWFTLALPIFALLLFDILFIAAESFFLTIFATSIYLLASMTLIIILITTSLIAKLIVDWYCHFYLLTTHRILEVCYKPLFSNHINNVILNQVKSTEIDIEKTGFINQLLDMGNVLVTFDRPTHYEQFCFINIKDPKSVGFLLADILDFKRAQLDLMENPVWYKTKRKERPFGITDEIFPKQAFGVT